LNLAATAGEEIGNVDRDDDTPEFGILQGRGWCEMKNAK
jgi:hypothetical protein